MKKLLTERFQELAGIKPLYEQESDTDTVAEILRRYQSSFSDMLGYANSFFRAVEEGKTLSDYDSQEGSRIESDPSWSSIKETLQGQELYLYLLYHVSKISNIQPEVPIGNKGDLNNLINSILDDITEYNINGEELAEKFPNSPNINNLGSGDVNEDKDILMKLLSLNNFGLGGGFDWEIISREEMYKILQSGTLDSSSYHVTTSVATQQGINRSNSDDVVDKYASSLGGGTDRQGNSISEMRESIKRKKLAESVLKMTKILLSKRTLNEGPADNLELKNMAKQLFSKFKKLGAPVQINKQGSGKSDLSKGGVILVVGDNHVEVSLIGDRAMGMEDEIKKEFSQFKFGRTNIDDNPPRKQIFVFPGETTS
tara:strand:- start:102 stop:1211 length:1110 start_codon:yes stop_codon:yes gene_type:complete